MVAWLRPQGHNTVLPCRSVAESPAQPNASWFLDVPDAAHKG